MEDLGLTIGFEKCLVIFSSKNKYDQKIKKRLVEQISIIVVEKIFKILVDVFFFNRDDLERPVVRP